MIVVLGAAVALLRTPVSSWNLLWAEDGPIFVTGAYAGDPLVFFEAYAGYMHAVPRLLAALATIFVPLEYVPLAVSILAALLTSLVAAAVYLFARLRINSTLLCCTIALQVVALPAAGGEVANNVANSHWYLIFGAFWAAIVVPRTVGLRVIQVVVVAAAVLSDPLAAVLIAPLIIVRLFAIRPYRSTDHIVTLAFLAASLLQGAISSYAVLVQGSRAFASEVPPFADFFQVYSEHVVLDSLVGATGTTALFEAFGLWSLTIALVIVATLLMLVAWRARSRRALILAFAAGSIGFTGVVYLLLGPLVIGLPPGALIPAGRYWVVPTLLLVSAYAVCLDWLASRVGPRTAWIPVAAFVAASIVICAVDFRILDVRAGAVPWDQAVDDAAETCELPTASPPGPEEFAEAVIAPNWFTPVSIPCDILIPASVRN